MATIHPTLPSVVDEIEIEAKRFESDEINVNLNIIPQVDGVRTRTDLVCVIDVSGSMGIEVTNGDANESQGLRVIDVVKHAAKTVVKSLNEYDRFCLVSYSNTSEVKFPLAIMNEQGKEEACNAIDVLIVGGQTNLWDGLHNGVKVLNDNKDNIHTGAVLLLTDGQPNIVPPRGHIAHLKQFRDEYGLDCSISTFGFGYNLDSQLLKDLAREGQGSYSFIPDGSFVGTAFINTTSNILSTALRNVKIKIEVACDISCLGYDDVMTKTSWGYEIPISSINVDQNKDILIKTSKENSSIIDTMKITIEYVNRSSEIKSIECNEINFIEDVSHDIEVNIMRLNFVVTVDNAIKDFNAGNHSDAQQKIIHLIEQVKQTKAYQEQNVIMVDILADLEGQVTEALSRSDWFNKWGKHYLPSLVNAHYIKQSNNFKDPGIQHYGGDLFKALCKIAEDEFLKLPPPTPSIQATPVYGAAASSAPVARVVDMSAYYNADGGCFIGSCEVELNNGTKCRIDNLKRGVSVKTLEGYAEVKYIVKTMKPKNNKTFMIRIPHGSGKLNITPWHPIYINGIWTFPAQIAKKSNENLIVDNHLECVYNLALEDGTNVIIEEVPVLTLGHGIKDDKVAKHEYYGTNNVTNDLKKLECKDGLIVIEDNYLTKRANDYKSMKMSFDKLKINKKL